jgi:hypothetical protein
MPKKLTFTHDDGRVSTRSSDRPYTHVIVGRVDLVAARQNLVESQRSGESWDYSHDMAKIKVGERMWADRPYLMSEADAAKYADFMATNPDRAAYVEKRRQEGLAQLAKQHGTGDKSPEYVLQWSMSAANAMKALPEKQKWHIDVAVKPVDA